ncbi:MAG: hypothetical protein K8F35_12660 [Dokdonella sp.]|uniref:hypothetical protein n=1 Tax=Dokdonella sp. TaxID=2291710 RepID=UPI0025B9F669|nr:hypothetical protein [Dokdonella sp.]MBZ0223867.1 hypothetical protein [Dokdonella sp.]
MRPKSLVTAALALACTVALPALAGDTDVDPSFAWVLVYEPTASNPTQDENGIAIAGTADGGYVVLADAPGGGAMGGTGKRILLHRLDHGGERVASFGDSGVVVKDAWLTSVTAMAIDPQGRIVVVGATPDANGRRDFGVVRFKADGSDDTSFAGDGGTAIGFDIGGAQTNDLPTSVTIDPNGKIVIAGNVTQGDDVTTQSIGLIRLNDDGSLDTGFGDLVDGAGRHGSISRYFTSEVADVRRVLRIANGYYAVLGSTQFSANDMDFAARVFAPDGKALTNGGSYNRFAVDLSANDWVDVMLDAALVNPTRVLLTGIANAVTTQNCAALRIQFVFQPPNQVTVTLDPSFVGNQPSHYVYASPVATSQCWSGAADASGRMLLVGTRPGSTAYRVGSVTRLLPDGQLDNSFAPVMPDGTALYSAPVGLTQLSYNTKFSGIFMDGSQAVIVGSAAYSSSSTSDLDARVMRLSASDWIFVNGFE